MSLAPGLLLLAAAAWASASPVIQPGTISIDTQEWRGEPQRHLYIHGTLNGDTAFRLLLPERDLWQGRMLQYLQGGLGGYEGAGTAAGHDGYALANGAVYVESSQGHAGIAAYEEDDTPEEIAYGASYAVAQYAQARCVEIYGRPAQYVYVFGDSGGGHRASGLIERFPELYDGAMPCVGAGVFQVPWYLFSLYEQCRPVLLPLKEPLAEACQPGGKLDLSAAEWPEAEAALRRLLFAGFPAPALDTIRADATSLIILDYNKYKLDPGYFEDFWSVPGYAGCDGAVDGEIVEGLEGTVSGVDPEKRRLTVEFDDPPGALYGMTLTFASGALEGRWRRVYGSQGEQLVIGPVGPGIDGAAPGDRVVLDNRDLVAFRRLHEHLRDPEDRAMAGHPEDREPARPARTPETAPGIFEPDRPLGHVRSKMIAVYGSHDPLVWPTNAFTYARHVKNALGSEMDNHFRLHFVENGVHNPIAAQEPARFVGRVSLMHKAMDDLMAWVERDVPPRPGTAFTVDEQNQLKLAETANERGGYQPVVSLSVDGGGPRLETRTGRAVTFRVAAEDPDNDLARCEMDFEGDGVYDASREATGQIDAFKFSHTYDRPGEYYPVARITDATRSAGSPGPGIQNLARMRVRVTAPEGSAASN